MDFKNYFWVIIMKNAALITGASSGIGKELATIHAENGNNLILIARRKEKLEQLKKELQSKYSVKIEIISKDLTNSNAPKEIYEEVKKLNVEIQYLINNAGFGGLGKFIERNWQDDLDMINLNIIALANLTGLFLPDFVNRNSGRILNVSSTASLMPGPFQATYYATKAFVTSFSNAIAEELYNTNVTVTTLMPGPTATEFGKVSGMNKTKMFQNSFSARKVAEDGYKAMMDGKLDVITALSFSQKIMTKFIPFLPKKMLLKTVRKMQEV